MKRPVHLPLYHEFLELFDNYEIQNWEAKKFWEKLNINQIYRNDKTKRLMYSGLKVLIRFQYLEVNHETSRKNVFSYTETPRMNELRANSNMRCDSLKSLMIINKLSKFL